MTQVDFYVLSDTTLDQRHWFACRLAEKAFKLGHRVYLYSANSQHSSQLDTLLWSFRDSSFVPHQQLGNGEDETQVLIGHAQAPASHHDVLINLADHVPEFFSRFTRVSEVVVQQPDIIAKTRENYRFYRDRGYPMKTHNLG